MTADAKTHREVGVVELPIQDGEGRMFFRIEAATGDDGDGRKFDVAYAGMTVVVGVRDDDEYRTYVVGLRPMIEQILAIDAEEAEGLSPLPRLANAAGAARRRYEKAVEARFRAGDPVHVRHGDNLIPAEVVKSRDERVTVRSHTGKTYQVDGYRLWEHDHPDPRRAP